MPGIHEQVSIVEHVYIEILDPVDRRNPKWIGKYTQSLMKYIILIFAQ